MRATLLRATATRVLGESQGYLPLPVRDGRLPDGTPYMDTEWALDADEVERLRLGGRVRVRILGRAHPPIKLEVV